MTEQGFQVVQIGSHASQLEQKFGKPYDINVIDDGLREYRYIERVQVAPCVVDHIHYIFVVDPRGKVVNKEMIRMGGSVNFNVH